jgi:hypothetical protein
VVGSTLLYSEEGTGDAHRRDNREATLPMGMRPPTGHTRWRETLDEGSIRFMKLSSKNWWSYWRLNSPDLCNEIRIKYADFAVLLAERSLPQASWRVCVAMEIRSTQGLCTFFAVTCLVEN